MRLTRRRRLQAAIERRGVDLALGVRVFRNLLARTRSEKVDGHVLDPELAALCRLDDLVGPNDISRFGVAGARVRLAGSMHAIDGERPQGISSRDLEVPGPAGSLRARLYTPMGIADDTPGILFFHGGGFVTCDLDTHDTVCRHLAHGANSRLLALDYRLAPEHPYPAAVDDAVAAFRWLAQNAKSLGMDAGRLALAGDSAGGNLSAVLARKLKDDAVRPCLHVPIYPALDARRNTASHATFSDGYMLTSKMLDWYYDQYGPDVPRRLEPDFSPLLADDLSGLSPALVYTAGFDPLRDEAATYVERLTSSGVRATLHCFPTLLHGFIVMGAVSEVSHDAVYRIARDIRAELHR